MKILILGGGAIGGSVAADLLMAKVPITLADPWPDLVNHVRTQGISIQLPEGQLQTPPHNALHLSDFASQNVQYDIVFLAVKAPDARWLSEFIKPYLAPNGFIVPLNECNDEPNHDGCCWK
jgi:2-dehydropantoate 2-reductase